MFSNQLKCCGIDDYHDFDEAEKWQSTREFEVSGITVETEMVTPVACCKMDGTFPSVEPVDDQCSITPTDPTSNWNSVCGLEFLACNTISSILDPESLFHFPHCPICQVSRCPVSTLYKFCCYVTFFLKIPKHVESAGTDL